MFLAPAVKPARVRGSKHSGAPNHSQRYAVGLKNIAAVAWLTSHVARIVNGAANDVEQSQTCSTSAVFAHELA